MAQRTTRNGKPGPPASGLRNSGLPSPKPPRWADRLLEWLLPPRLLEDVQGDLHEVFYRQAEEEGAAKARRAYLLAVLAYLRPFYLKRKPRSYPQTTSTAMLGNYLIIALRTLWRQRTYATLNAAGLALGMACCLLIFLVVRFELGFDDFHSRQERIYRVVQHVNRPEGMRYNGRPPYALGKSLRTDFPQLEQVAQIHYDWGGTVAVPGRGKEPARYEESGVIFAGPSFGAIFDYQWLAGSARTALAGPNAVVLTETLAKKYFGNGTALGRTINYKNQLDLEVTGVIKDPPRNTHLPFSMLVSYSSFKAYAPDFYDSWQGSWAGATYVLLPEGYAPGQLEGQFVRFKSKYLKAEDAKRTDFFLQPLRKVHTDDKYFNLTRTASMDVIAIMVALGIFILVIACINYVNLATAQSVRRAKEVGIRKVLGSRRVQVVGQFMGETLILTGAAVLLAGLLAQSALPTLNQFLGFELAFSWLDAGTWLFLAAVAAGVCLLAGLYPAVVLAAYQPVQALKKNMSSRSKRALPLRQTLVVFQFVLSQALIIGTLVIARQMDYFRNRPLGFEGEAVVVLPLPKNDADKLSVLRNELKGKASVSAVSFASGAPMTWNSYTTSLFSPKAGPDAEHSGEIKFVDPHYLETFGLELIAGRGITEADGRDTVYQYVVNETLLQKIGYASPSAALGQMLHVAGHQGPIVGVVRDFHNTSLQNQIQPCAFTYDPKPFFQAFVKIKPEGVPETLAALESSWKGVFPQYVYGSEFLGDYLQGQYRAEEKQFKLFRILAGIAIFIGCLGLYGLVSFMAAQRTKEIGIRKVLGASAGQIVGLFCREFVRLVLIAFLVSGPAAYYLMGQWLQDFAYKTDLGAPVFLTAIGASLLIALLTVGFRSVTAALADPVKSLRSE